MPNPTPRTARKARTKQSGSKKNANASVAATCEHAPLCHNCLVVRSYRYARVPLIEIESEAGDRLWSSHRALIVYAVAAISQVFAAFFTAG